MRCALSGCGAFSSGTADAGFSVRGAAPVSTFAQQMRPDVFSIGTRRSCTLSENAAEHDKSAVITSSVRSRRHRTPAPLAYEDVYRVA